MEQTDEVQPRSLPDFEFESRLRESGSGSGESEINMELGFSEAVAEFERNIISAALKQNQNNVNQSAEQLKMTGNSLRYRMQQLGLIGTRNNGDDSGDGK